MDKKTEVLGDAAIAQAFREAADRYKGSGHYDDFIYEVETEAALAAQPAPVDGDRRPFAFCCAEGGGRIEGCSCVNKDHGFAVFPGKRPSVESLWQAFWATPHDEREWNRPIGTDGKPMPMTLISFKYEVVRAAFEIDTKRDSQEESK